MRFLHFNAWLAMQRHDAVRKIQADVGSDTWWRTETANLQDQLNRIQHII
jgi:hypothetical protein